MSLLLTKLQLVKDLGDGGQQARCPACAELGHDRKGEHLRLYPDGRFGCCVHPKDREHRKRIFALAGNREPQSIRVKVVRPKTQAPLQRDVLGRLGRLFATQNGDSAITADILGTAGTPFFYLVPGRKLPILETAWDVGWAGEAAATVFSARPRSNR